MAEKNKPGPWERSAKLLPKMYARLGEGWAYPPIVTTQEPSRNTVATCGECGGKYRPAGGPCIHEQATELWRQAEASYGRSVPATIRDPRTPHNTGYSAVCAMCGVAWQPGHTCIRQPTAQEMQDMREQAYWCRVLEDVLDHFGYETQVAAPASWEAV